jgi:hypothetical protein
MGREEAQDERRVAESALAAAIPGRVPKWPTIARVACLLYVSVLTYLLLTPHVEGVSRFWFLPRGPGDVVVHFITFVGLGAMVAFSRVPLARQWLLALLAAYALSVELLQFLSPPRTVDLRDAIANLLGLGAGLAAGEFALRFRTPAGKNAMAPKQRVRLLTHDGLATYDTFVLADETPENINPDCVLVVNEATGHQLTVHRSRLLPAEDLRAVPIDHERKSPCPTCGEVAGVVEDRITCPHENDGPCSLLEDRP